MQNYNLIQKLFHDTVFKRKIINKTLFEIEKLFFLRENNIKKNLHIFISGLPRSGTTSLLNYIYLSGDFASLKYSNMPFILSPNFSHCFYKKNSIKKERAHMDGIFYDLNSPEAFDEVFFKNSEKFIREELMNYIKLIIISEKKERYLSKNNYNFKRIDLIQSILPNSIFLITIRNPYQHCYSLLKQHQHFVLLQKNDDFIRRYMNYLGHNEFGLNHYPWNQPINFHETKDINYWLEQWCLFYEDIFNKYKNNKNCLFVIYEQLINDDYIKKLCNKIKLNFDVVKKNYFKISYKNNKINVNQNILVRANEIYQKFHS